MQEDPAFAERQRRGAKKWHGVNKERRAAYRKRPEVALRLRDSSILSKRRRTLARFGLTWEREQELLDAQGWVCAICHEPPQRPFLDIDHDHSTGAFRGFICGRCNKGLGLLGDSAESLRKALRYLETHTARTG